MYHFAIARTCRICYVAFTLLAWPYAVFLVIVTVFSMFNFWRIKVHIMPFWLIVFSLRFHFSDYASFVLYTSCSVYVTLVKLSYSDQRTVTYQSSWRKNHCKAHVLYWPYTCKEVSCTHIEPIVMYLCFGVAMLESHITSQRDKIHWPLSLCCWYSNGTTWHSRNKK